MNVLSSKTIAAVDGAVTAGLKGNLAGLAALGANSVKHLTAVAAAASGAALAGITARFAALGLIGEAFLGVELLLAGGENEFLAAIFAY